MNRWHELTKSAGILMSVLFGKVAAAQVIADPTLNLESSRVNTTLNNGNLVYNISGGARRDANLFHSFEQFSVPTGATATFLNADTVENIISRVTGANPSNLDGTIRASGSANLFLINPAGIVIGPNARLDIGGSFLGSTGRGLRFHNNFLYDTENANAPPLLTINSPMGLVMGNSPGGIRIGGQRNSTPLNFSVAQGETLALIGSHVVVQGGRLNAPAGHIELAAISGINELSIDTNASGFDIGLDGVQDFGDIRLSGQAVVDVSGPAGGTIQIQGQSVTITDQSALISDTLGNLAGGVVQVVADRFSLQDNAFIGAAAVSDGAGSNISLTAQDVALLGTSIFNYKLLLQTRIPTGERQLSDRQIGGVFATTTGSGQAGHIVISAQTVLVNEGMVISTESLGPGNSGDITITASEHVRVRGSGIITNSLVPGVPLFNEFGIATGLSTIGIPAGAAGDITINTAQLTVADGASISAATLSDRSSGNIVIEASDAIVLQGFFEPIPFPTAITTATVGGNGEAGNIRLETGRLTIQDGAEISASSGSPTFQGTIPFGGAAGNLSITATESIDVVGSSFHIIPLLPGEGLRRFLPSTIASTTFSPAPAGAIQIATPQLSIQAGGRITSATFDSGEGGAVNIAAETIVIAGSSREGSEFISGIFASSGTPAQACILDGCAPLTREQEPLLTSGAGGTITINAQNLAVQDAAEISVSSLSLGTTGNLDITADAIHLTNQGALTATIASGQGGNINLNGSRLMLDSSRISTSTNSGDGGNLSFNLKDTLILRNHSLLSTEAGTAGAGGNGGDITLNLPDGFIIAVPVENSDIRANAFEGNGGNVSVTARSLIGIDFRPDVLDTPLSDITASSRFGTSGTVIINELSPDVVQNDATLPTETAPPALAQGCQAPGSQMGSFVITGRGGLPTNPADPLGAETIWQDLAPLPQVSQGDRDRPSTAEVPETVLVEAQSWIQTKDGTIVLLAQPAEPPDFPGLLGDCIAEQAG